MLFEHDPNDDYAVVLCPNCGNNNTHHAGVSVMTRKREDGDGTRVDVSRVGMVSQLPITGHALGRRNAIAIELWCEGCDVASQLEIIQHKGLTLLKVTKLAAPAVKPVPGDPMPH